MCVCRDPGGALAGVGTAGPWVRKEELRSGGRAEVAAAIELENAGWSAGEARAFGFSLKSEAKRKGNDHSRNSWPEQGRVRTQRAPTAFFDPWARDGREWGEEWPGGWGGQRRAGVRAGLSLTPGDPVPEPARGAAAAS